jgi:PAS domain S-box-containing protein
MLRPDEKTSFIQHLTEDVNLVLWIAQYEPYKMLYLSDSYGNIWGRPKEDIYDTPESWQSHIVPEHRQKTTDLWKQAPEGRYQCEYEIERPDGTRRWIKNKSWPICIEGRPVRIIGISEDITETKKSEKVITDLAIFPFENPSPVLRVDKDGILIYANPASNELLKEWKCKIGKISPWWVQKLANDALKNNTVETVESGNDKKILSFLAVPLKSKDYVNLYARDITVEKKILDKLEKTNKELEYFAYIASHDLQEPLRTVTSYVQLLTNNYKDIVKHDNKAKQYIDFILDATKRMKNLIQNLLIYSSSGKILPGENINFPEILKKAIENLSIKIKSSKAKIVFDPSASIPLYGQHEDATRVFINLISNSIKFKQNDRRPYISISASEPNENGYVCFSVKDNGVGIAKEDHKKLFKMFQRLKTNSQSRGSGIGLSICKRIVEKHGGRIWIESDINKGAKFCFTFPCTKEVFDHASSNC